MLLIQSPPNSSELPTLLSSSINSGKISNPYCSLFTFENIPLTGYLATVDGNSITATSSSDDTNEIYYLGSFNSKIVLGSSILWDEISLTDAPTNIEVDETFIGYSYGDLGLSSEFGGGFILNFDSGSGQSQYGKDIDNLVGTPFTISYPLVIHLELNGDTGDVRLTDNQGNSDLLIYNNPNLGSLILYPIFTAQHSQNSGSTVTAVINGGYVDPEITPTSGALNYCKITEGGFNPVFYEGLLVGSGLVESKEVTLERQPGDSFSPVLLSSIGSFLSVKPNMSLDNPVIECELLELEGGDFDSLSIGDNVVSGLNAGTSRLLIQEHNAGTDFQLVWNLGQDELGDSSNNLSIILANYISIPVGTVLIRILNGDKVRYGFKTPAGNTVLLSGFIPSILGSYTYLQPSVYFSTSLAEDNEVYRLGLNNIESDYTVTDYPSGTKDAFGTALTTKVDNSYSHSAIFEDTYYKSEVNSSATLSNSNKTITISNTSGTLATLFSWTSKLIGVDEGIVCAGIEFGPFTGLGSWLTVEFRSLFVNNTYITFAVSGPNLVVRVYEEDTLTQEETIVGLTSAITHMAFEFDTDNNTVKSHSKDAINTSVSVSVPYPEGPYVLRVGAIDMPTANNAEYTLNLSDTIPSDIKDNIADGAVDLEGTSI